MKNNQIKVIEQQVLRFRQDVGLGNTDAINLRSLLLKLNILTLFRPLSDDFSGMCLKDTLHRFMLINSNQSLGRQHFTIGHELYHLYIEDTPTPHRCSLESGHQNIIEQHANMFASILLMPEEGILQMLSEEELLSGSVLLATIIKLEHYYQVSRTALLNRLSSLSLLTKSVREKYAHIPVIQSAREYGYDTSLYKHGNKNLVIGDFGEKARTLFDLEKISEGHYIELLNKVNYNGED